MQGARQSGSIHRKRRLFLAVHDFRCTGLRAQSFGEGERLERSHGFVGSGQPVFRRKTDRRKSGRRSRLRDSLDQRDLGLPGFGPYGFADGEPPGLVFPETGFRRRDVWSHLLGCQLPETLAPVGFLLRGGPS